MKLKCRDAYEKHFGEYVNRKCDVCISREIKNIKGLEFLYGLCVLLFMFVGIGMFTLGYMTAGAVMFLTAVISAYVFDMELEKIRERFKQ